MENRTNQNLLIQIEKISSEAANCKLDLENLPSCQEDIEEVASFLGITRDQVILFSCLVDLSLQRTVTLDGLARHFKCSTLKIINQINELEILEKQKLIRKSIKSRSKNYSYTDLGYSVPQNVIESLRTMDKSILQTTVSCKLPTFLEQVTCLINEREDNSITTQILRDQIEFLILNNLNHPFIQFVNSNLKLTIDKCVVFVLAYYRLRRQISCDFESLLNSIFDDFSEQTEYLQNISAGNSDLIRRNIARFQETAFVNDKNLVLSPRITELLFKQYPELYILEDIDENLIKSKSIISKKLYYEVGLKKQIDSLTSILMNKSFSQFQAKLQEYKLPKGITAIFYGQPGSGKTETAFQIAKRTNRDILMVELSQLKSKWFGESEKKIKAVFDDYRQYFNNTLIKPILFINEADGMFSKRTEISTKGSSTDQTMNTIQNIILQELENFEGILFATTNLTENLDNAFERRFLFKVEFKNPLPEVREKIWKEKLPELKPVQVRNISEKYQLSGGEIENVVRKYIIEKVIEKKQLSLERLMEFCELEKPFQKHQRIGFQI